MGKVKNEALTLKQTPRKKQNVGSKKTTGVDEAGDNIFLDLLLVYSSAISLIVGLVLGKILFH